MKKVLSIILIIVVLAGLVAGICALVHKFKPNTGLAVIRPIQKGDQITGFELNEKELLKLDYEKLIKDIEPQRQELETDGEYVEVFVLVDAEGLDAESGDDANLGLISVIRQNVDGVQHYGLCIGGICVGEYEITNPIHIEQIANLRQTYTVNEVHNTIKLIGVIKPIYAESK